MRSLPAPVRVVLATLVIRYRAARRDHLRTAKVLGADHTAAIAAHARVNELWNTLQAVRTNLFDELDGTRVSVGDAHAFIRYVGIGAKVRREAALRAA